jgi:hypothetical protein
MENICRDSDHLGVGADEFAFINLARCPDPRVAKDDDAISACQQSFPIAELIEVIDARVVFFAKQNALAKRITIPR